MIDWKETKVGRMERARLHLAGDHEFVSHMIIAGIPFRVERRESTEWR